MEVLFSLKVEEICLRNISLIFCQCRAMLSIDIWIIHPFWIVLWNSNFSPIWKTRKICAGNMSFALFLSVMHSVYGDSFFWCIHIETCKWFLFCCSLQIVEFSVWKIRLICSPLSWLDITLIQTNGSRLRIFFCLFSKVCENSYGRNLFDFVSWCSCHRHPFDSYKWRHINEFLVRKQKPKHKHIVEPNVATEYDFLEVPTYVSPPVYSLP